MSQFAQPEGSCLRYPEAIQPQREVTYEAALSMLLRAMSMAQTVPFAWGYVDKPADGTVLLLFLPPGNAFPNDGIRWQDSEIKAIIPAGGRELEVCELKYGFIPGSGESNASRVRRRYRLLKGGNPQLVLIHYTRGQPSMIQPAFMNQPVRAYPLRPIDIPAVYVAGEKQGQKVFPPGMQPGMQGGGGGGGMHPSASGGSMPPVGMGGGGQGGGPATATIGMGMPMHQQQAMLAQQNNSMEALERRRERERAAAVAAAAHQGQAAGRPQQRGPIHDDEDDEDEIDQISTRTLAMARYKRNHDWMNEVFHKAAFGKIVKTDPKPAPYSIFKKTELEEKTAKLQAEVEALQSGIAQRRAEKIQALQNQDTTMGSIGDAITV